MKRLSLLSFSITALSTLMLTLSICALANPSSTAPSPVQVPVAAASTVPDAPQLAATGFILIDGETGDVLAESNADKRLPPASLTKMMSSYLAVEEVEQGRIAETTMLPVSVKAWKMEGSRMYVKEGTQVAMIDLLRGEIIQSGNDATVALAEFIGGTEDSFVNMMNKKAEALGMKDTHFENASGLPSPNHYTTARDLARLARAVINDHPAHYPLYAEKHFTYNNIRQPNRNLLLNRDPSVDGLKTGHTDEAGFCLVASAKRDGQRLITVVLGTKSEDARAVETQKLLEYGFRYYENVTLYKPNTMITKARLSMGKAHEVDVGLEKEVHLTIPRGRVTDLVAKVHLNPEIKAPIKQGDVLGSLSVELDKKIVNESSLIALQPVEEANFFVRLWDKMKLFFKHLFS